MPRLLKTQDTPPAVEFATYTDADLALTEALETDPEMMRELGGPTPRADLARVHRRRLDDPWWFKVVVDGQAAGTIGIWETEHDGAMLHETGWMILPAFQRRGIASAALETLLERARAEPQFHAIHAFPATTNVPSNALCRKFGFTLLDVAEFSYRGATLRCNHWALDTPERPEALRRPRA